MIKNLAQLIDDSDWNETEIAALMGVREGTIYRYRRTNAQGLGKKKSKAIRSILKRRKIKGFAL